MPNAQVVAVAEADHQRLGAGKEFVDKTYGNSDCTTYTDFRDLLDRKDIDAVFAATPHHWHAIMTIMACQAGKDVYSEKPLSLTIREAVKMAEASNEYSRVVQGGTQARSSPTITFAVDQIKKGAIGDVKKVLVGCWGQPIFMDIEPEPIPDYLDWEMFVGPAKMCAYSSKAMWGMRREFSGGAITDWGHHFFDVAQWGIGMDESGPVEVYPVDDNHEFVTLRYENGVEVQLHAKDNERLSTGTTFIGTQGKIYTQAWEDYVEFEPKELGVQYLEEHNIPAPQDLDDRESLAVQINTTVPPAERDDFSDDGTGLHVANFINCVQTREKPNADVQLSRRSVTLAHLVNVALWENRPLKWDPEKFEFPGDEKANSYLHIEPRAPWKL